MGNVRGDGLRFQAWLYNTKVTWSWTSHLTSLSLILAIHKEREYSFQRGHEKWGSCNQTCSAYSEHDSYYCLERRSTNLLPPYMVLKAISPLYLHHMLSAERYGVYKTEEYFRAWAETWIKDSGSCFPGRDPVYAWLHASLLLLTFPLTSVSFSCWILNLDVSPCVCFYLEALSLPVKS